jgi:hypothetical protein
LVRPRLCDTHGRSVAYELQSLAPVRAGWVDEPIVCKGRIQPQVRSQPYSVNPEIRPCPR